MQVETTRFPVAKPTHLERPFRKVLLTLVGLIFGTSAIFSGFYDTTVWEPVLLAALSILVAVLIARPAVPIGSAAVAIGGLLALWFWSLLSSSWAEAADLAVTDANRWLLYGVVLLLLLYLADDAESRRWLLGATSGGALIVAVYILIRFLAGEGPDMFVANRLDGPLGYINGVATYLLVGVWPLVALAERARNPVIRGFGVFGAVQLVSLTVLTQSRGAVVALVASTALILLVVPGRLTRAWVLLIILGGAAISVPSLRDVIDNAGAEPTAEALRSIAETSVLAGIAAGTVWAVACLAVSWVDRQPESTWRSMRWMSAAAISAIALVGVGAIVANPGQRIDQIQDHYNTFTSLQPTDGGSRLTSGGGNRYDYWRVATRQLKDHPLNGVGAGNYRSTYYQERSTSEDVQQAHSLEMQTLGELGLVGGLAAAAFMGAIFLGFWRTARGSSSHRANPTLAVAAGGTFMVWLFQTSVDWMHLIPGLTAVALCGAAALLPAVRPLNRWMPTVAIIFVTVAAGLAAYPVANQLLALRLQDNASEKVRTDPVGALEDTRGSLSLQAAQRTYYLQSAALARLGLYEPARASLLAAIKDVPHDFVAWGLLGDLASRRGLRQEARENYQRALELNPRDPGLAALAKGEDRAPPP